jgi:predicted DNA-binding helix-hairpin-helix protein
MTAPYCVTRKSNDIQRAALSEEVVDLTINFTEEIISKDFFKFWNL